MRTPVTMAIGVLVVAAVLTACTPTKMGAAAIIGDQRITTAELNQAVSDWRDAYRRRPIPQQQLQQSMLDLESLPRTVLFGLITFRVTEQAARRQGITVTPGEIDTFIAQQGGQEALETASVQNGVAPRHARDLAEMFYLRGRLVQRLAPGLDQQQAAERLQAALQRTATAMDVRVNPRYGAYDVRDLVLGPVQFTLSRPESGTS